MTTNTTPHTPAAVRDADGLAVIGRTLHDLRGIRFDGGEGGNAPAGGQQGTTAGAAGQSGQPAAGQQGQQSSTSSPFPGPAQRQEAAPQGQQGAGQGDAGQQSQQQAGQGQQQDGQQSAQQPTDRQYTPEQTQQHISKLNGDVKSQRERAEAAEAAKQAAEQQLASVMAALGRNPDGTPLSQPNPEADKAQTAADTTARENLILRVAPTLSADADKMLDSRAFSDKLKGLKVDDRSGAEALVREWVEAHPEYKTVPPAASSSGSTTAHSGGAPVTGRQTRQQALAGRYAKK